MKATCFGNRLKAVQHCFTAVPDRQPEFPPNSFVFIWRQHCRIIGPQGVESCDSDFLDWIQEWSVARTPLGGLYLQVLPDEVLKGFELAIWNKHSGEVSIRGGVMTQVHKLDALSASGKSFECKRVTRLTAKFDLQAVPTIGPVPLSHLPFRCFALQLHCRGHLTADMLELSE